MAHSVALVQGASRGLGLQFCRSILSRGPSTTVVATCRNPSGAGELWRLQEEYKDRLDILQIDVTQENHIAQAAESVSTKFGRLDLLINSAGMLHPSGRGETSLRAVTAEGLQQTFLTNATGALMMAKHFSPLLTKGTGSFGAQGSDKKSQHKSILVNMSAKVGSITDNGLGGWYSYRMSKAALNMATKNLSVEFGRGQTRIICVALHPGTVDTDLSRPYHKNVPEGKLFSTEYSINCLMDIINQLTVSDSGKYFSWDGSQLPF